MKELVEYIAKSLVNDPSQVEVTEERRANTVNLTLEVAQEDVGSIAGWHVIETARNRVGVAFV